MKLLVTGMLIAFLCGHSIAQSSDQLDVTHYQLELDISLDHSGYEASQNTLRGRARISFIHPASDLGELTFLVHRLLSVDHVSINGERMAYTQRVRSLVGWETFQLNEVTLKDLPQAQKDTVVLEIKYRGHLSGYPETGMAYVKESLNPVFTIIRPESFSYPQLSAATETSLNSRWRGNDTFSQEVIITLPTTHIPASGYKLKEKRKQENRTTWEYTSEEPSGTILIPIAPYEKIEKNNFQVYYFAEDETGARQIATSVEKVIDLFTKWMGSLKEKHNFSLAEIPNDYGSQALMPTIIQTAKAFKDQQAMGELYHEISHFWNVRDKEIQSPRWNEGQAMYLQYLAYEELNEEGTLLPSLEKRLLRVKEYFESHPEKVAMSEYGKQEVTSTLSYSVGPLFYYLLDRVMGREKLLKALGEFYRKQWESGTTSIEFEEFMVKQDKRTKPIFRDWFTGAEYIELILHKSLAEIVKKYQ